MATVEIAKIEIVQKEMFCNLKFYSLNLKKAQVFFRPLISLVVCKKQMKILWLTTFKYGGKPDVDESDWANQIQELQK